MPLPPPHAAPCPFHSTPLALRFLQDFTAIKDLGRGTFGRVLKAVHKLDNQAYAVKVLRLDEDGAEEEHGEHDGGFSDDDEKLQRLPAAEKRLELWSRPHAHSHHHSHRRCGESAEARNKVLREVSTLSRLSHGNIVRYYQAWIERAQPPRIPGSDAELEDDAEADEWDDPER